MNWGPRPGSNSWMTEVGRLGVVRLSPKELNDKDKARKSYHKKDENPVFPFMPHNLLHLWSG